MSSFTAGRTKQRSISKPQMAKIPKAVRYKKPKLIRNTADHFIGPIGALGVSFGCGDEGSFPCDFGRDKFLELMPSGRYKKKMSSAPPKSNAGYAPKDRFKKISSRDILNKFKNFFCLNGHFNFSNYLMCRLLTMTHNRTPYKSILRGNKVSLFRSIPLE